MINILKFEKNNSRSIRLQVHIGCHTAMLHGSTEQHAPVPVVCELLRKEDLTEGSYTMPPGNKVQSFHNRLTEVSAMLCECDTDNIISCVLTSDGPCVLQWSEMHVLDVVEFHRRMLSMVTDDKYKHWNRLGRFVAIPTRGVYEVLRRIGIQAKKGSRGPAETDPGHGDMLYFQEWFFKQKNVYIPMLPRASVAGVG